LCPLCWFSCQYLPNDWLERLLWGHLFVSRRLSPQTPDRRVLMNFGIVYCFIILLHVCLVPRPHTIYFILLRHDLACYAESAVEHQSTIFYLSESIHVFAAYGVAFQTKHFIIHFFHIITTGIPALRSSQAGCPSCHSAVSPWRLEQMIEKSTDSSNFWYRMSWGSLTPEDYAYANLYSCKCGKVINVPASPVYCCCSLQVTLALSQLFLFPRCYVPIII